MSDQAPPSNTPKRRKSIGPFAIVSSSIWSNAKICKAGPDAVLVFVFALTKNAERGRSGSFPASEMEPWFLARQLGFDAQRAEKALSACVDARLLDLDGGECHVVGWDEDWKRAALTEAETERKRAYRERVKISTAAGSKTKTKTKNRDPRGRDRERDRDREVPDMSGTSPDSVCLSPLEVRLDEISVSHGHGHITWGPIANARQQLAALASEHGDAEVATRWENVLRRAQGEFPTTRTIGVFVKPSVFDGASKRVMTLADLACDEETAMYGTRDVLTTEPERKAPARVDNQFTADMSPEEMAESVQRAKRACR